MAAFADYLDLRLAVSERTGNTALPDVMPRFVQMAETDLNREIRHSAMVKEATLAFTDGVALLPVDFLEFEDVYNHMGCAMRQGLLSEVRQASKLYTVFAVNEAQVHTYGYTGSLTSHYYAKLPTLTAGPTVSNWLLATYPNAYFSATLYHAAKHLRDAELAQEAMRDLRMELRMIRADDERIRFARSAVTVQGATV